MEKNFIHVFLSWYVMHLCTHIHIFLQKSKNKDGGMVLHVFWVI